MNEYLNAVYLYMENNVDIRYGQALFNVLLERDPVLAEEIRGTKLDPFAWDQGVHTDEFLDWLCV